MATRKPSYIFQETRLNFEQVGPASIVHVRLPSTTSNARSSNHRRSPTTVKSTEEDEFFRHQCLASASSIYHRVHHDSPRAFLWRVLEGGSVLNIRAVDVVRSERAADCSLTLHLEFPARIRPHCVAFADPQHHDALAVFVLDEHNTLFSLMLRPDSFIRRAATEGGLGSDACRIHVTSAFSFKHPHRLVACSDELVIAALHDGGILKFERTKAHEGSGPLWKESHFNASSWFHGVRSMLPFKAGHTVKYGKINMEMAAATSLVTSNLGLDDGSAFLLSVCIDHQLRIWNLANGVVLTQKDLLDVKRDDKSEIGKWTVDPSQSNLVRVIPTKDGAICLTFSPIGAGEFKFWRIYAQDSNNIRIEDMFPRAQLQPPPPSNDIWTLADFALDKKDDGFYIWTLWKNNMSHRVQRIHIPPATFEAIGVDNVVDVYTDTTIDPAETANPCDPTDPTEKWLDLILYPGRFTRATLDTALAIYERGLGSSKESAKSGKDIADKICSALAQTVSLNRGLDGGMDYEQFRRANDTQWRRFYRLILELDKQRGEALNLVFDPQCNLYSGTVWVICTDLVSLVRESSDLDLVFHNLRAPPRELVTVAKLVATGLAFVEAFSDSMTQICRAVLRFELFEANTKTDMERLQFFSDKAGFWRQLSDEDCLQVTEALGSNFNKVNAKVYHQLFKMASAISDSRRRPVLNPLTGFGRKVAVKVTQEAAEMWHLIFFSQLILLVHMTFEFDSEEDALHQRLDVGVMYNNIIEILKRLELIRWLAQTEISVPVSKFDRNKGDSSTNSPVTSRSAAAREEIQTITALEGHVGHLLGLSQSKITNSFGRAFTDVACNLLAGDSDIELDPTLIQCSLIKQQRADLAFQLQPFTSDGPFATYIQGRMLLALKYFDAAARYFSKAAIGMSAPTEGERHSSGLLNEFEWNLLHSGMSQYYTHVASHFDVAKGHSHVIYFSRLALQFSPSITDRIELLSRIFSSATHISHFETAHNALVEMAVMVQPGRSTGQDHMSQQAQSQQKAVLLNSLRRLVSVMCDHQAAQELISLPFVGLTNYVDDELSARARSTSGQEGGIPYHDILYAFRIRQGDYRGAAGVLYDRLQKLKRNENERLPQPPEVSGDVLDTNITRLYLMLINTMSCVADGETVWIMAEQEEDEENVVDNDGEGTVTVPVSTSTSFILEPVVATTTSFASTISASDSGILTQKRTKVMANEGKKTKRKVLTLADIRRQYQEELDRIAAIQNNQFGFGDSDDGDVDMALL